MRSRRIVSSVGVLIILSLAASVVMTTYVTHIDSAELGLATVLPSTFWIGLVLLGIFLYVNRESDGYLLVGLVLVVLYLYGIPMLTKEYAAEFPISYYFAAEGELVLSEGHLEPTPSDSLVRYQHWPGFLFLTAFVKSLTSMPTSILCDYFPLFTISVYALLAFLILRVRLSRRFSFLGAMWFVNGFYVGQHYFSPQSMAYVLYLSIFLLLARCFYKRTKSSLVTMLTIVVLFTSASFWHPITPFVIIGGVAMMYIVDRFCSKTGRLRLFGVPIIILFLTIEFSHEMYVASAAFNFLTTSLYEQISRADVPILETAAPRVIGSTAQMFDLLSSSLILAVIAIIAVLAILQAFRGKGKWRNDVFWIAWVAGAGLFAVFRYGPEAHLRALMFGLVPISYLSTSFLARRPRVLCSILIVLLFLHVPAHYSTDSWRMVTGSEQEGTAFYSKYSPQGVPCFYVARVLKYLVFSHDPTRIRTPIVSSIARPPFFEVPNILSIKQAAESAAYVLYSDLLKNYYFYYFSLDPLELDRGLNLDGSSNRVHDNGGFLLYMKSGV